MPKRAVYEKGRMYEIIDAGFVCHVGFAEGEQPVVIPTLYARHNDTLYMHGSVASRMLKRLSVGLPVCVTITVIDGLVLARSAFHHSMNYRSVVVMGRARLVTEPKEKLIALKQISDHLLPQRWAHTRSPNQSELNGTSVLALPLSELSAKVRTGPPKDARADYALPYWAGVIPLRLVASNPVRDGKMRATDASGDPSSWIRPDLVASD